MRKIIVKKITAASDDINAVVKEALGEIEGGVSQVYVVIKENPVKLKTPHGTELEPGSFSITKPNGLKLFEGEAFDIKKTVESKIRNLVRDGAEPVFLVVINKRRTNKARIIRYEPKVGNEKLELLVVDRAENRDAAKKFSTRSPMYQEC